MNRLDQIIESEFSSEVVGVLNYRMEKISTLISDHMDVGVYEGIEDTLSTLLVEISKKFFTQGFLRGVAAEKGSAV